MPKKEDDDLLNAHIQVFCTVCQKIMHFWNLNLWLSPRGWRVRNEAKREREGAVELSSWPKPLV